jgi:hypothetical protein
MGVNFFIGFVTWQNNQETRTQAAVYLAGLEPTIPWANVSCWFKLHFFEIPDASLAGTPLLLYWYWCVFKRIWKAVRSGIAEWRTFSVIHPEETSSKWRFLFSSRKVRKNYTGPSAGRIVLNTAESISARYLYMNSSVRRILLTTHMTCPPKQISEQGIKISFEKTGELKNFRPRRLWIFSSKCIQNKCTLWKKCLLSASPIHSSLQLLRSRWT